MTFCGKEEQRRERALILTKKIGASDTKLAPVCDVSTKRCVNAGYLHQKYR